MRPKLAQGTNRIVRASNIVDGDEQALTVNGWSVLAAARAETVGGALLQVWATDPGEDQGAATASGRTVELEITPAMTQAWGTPTRVVIQVFITSPSGDQTERIIYETYDFEPEVLPA
jgi:hypothetical protein